MTEKFDFERGSDICMTMMAQLQMLTEGPAEAMGVLALMTSFIIDTQTSKQTIEEKEESLKLFYDAVKSTLNHAFT